MTTIESTDGPADLARFKGPGGVAVDSQGNVYVADRGNLTIRKISPAGNVTTLAGTAGQTGSNDGTGQAAQFAGPTAVAVDSGGNVFVADIGNSTIRKVSPAGVVTTLAGKVGVFGYTDGAGSDAGFYFPSGVAVDDLGNVYVADAGNCMIRKITSAGIVTTLAGAPIKRGWRDGIGSDAMFDAPLSVTVDGSGNVYVADSGNSVIRKITSAGVVTTLAGKAGEIGAADGTGAAARFNRPLGVSADKEGNVYVADAASHTIRKVTSAGVVTTVAGTAGLSDMINGPGNLALFYDPSGLTVDRNGVVYVCDRGNNQIRKITTDRMVTTFAGAASSLGADGTGSTANFVAPNGVALDGAGNVFVSDNGTIRKITAGGVVTTLAGKAGFSGSSDGSGSAARFNSLGKLAVDNAGNIYVADSGNDTIRKITPAGVVTTVAGAVGQQGAKDGIGSAAQFNLPSGVAIDATGNIYVADPYNNLIRKITPSGVVTTFVEGPPGSSWPAKPLFFPSVITVDRAGNLYVADNVKTISKITPAGVATTLAGKPSYHTHLDPPVESVDGTGEEARFTSVGGLAVDTAGNVYLTDVDTIRKITPAGMVTTVAGTAGIKGSTDGTGSNARFNRPGGLAVDDQGNVYIADTGNGLIRRMNVSGVVATFAGSIGSAGSVDGIGSAARFSGPSGLTADGASNVYLADTYNNTIRKITAAGTVTTLAGKAGSAGSTDGAVSTAQFNSPVGVAVDGIGNVYAADTGNNTIRKVTTSGTVMTIAGTAGIAGTADGVGSKAQFTQPEGVAVDSTGNVYVADTGNQAIRKIAPDGTVTTLAGPTSVSVGGAGLRDSTMNDEGMMYAASTGNPTGSTDGAGSAARFNHPTGLIVDRAGIIYVADTDNHTIRKITQAGVVTTLAGAAGARGWVDGAGGNARFNYPVGLSVDQTGNVYIADAGNMTIRKITPGGVVTSISGLAGSTGWIFGTGLAAQFDGTEGVTVDSAGNVYVSCSSTNSNNIRKGQLAGPPTITQQPQSQTIALGSSVQMSVTAAAVPSATYQWYFNGSPFSGATTNTLSFTNARTADAGDYNVVLTNELGSVTSAKATLTVTAAPVITPPPAAKSGGGGGAISPLGLAALALLVWLRRRRALI